MKTCPACGESLRKTAKTCKECGFDVSDVDEDESVVDRIMALGAAAEAVERIRTSADLAIADDTHIDLGSGHGFPVGIAGESQRQSTLRTLSAGRREHGQDVSFVVELIPEPANPYDANAVRINIVNGAQVGYLAREDAAAYRRVFDALTAAGKRGVCHAKLIGGTDDKPSFGVLIDLTAPEKLLALDALGGQPF